MRIASLGHAAFAAILIVTSCAITAGAWVVADSYRSTPWLAVRRP